MTDRKPIWPLEAKAEAICAQLRPLSDAILPQEILSLNEATAAIITDISGEDFVLTLARVPAQRPRPARN